MAAVCAGAGPEPAVFKEIDEISKSLSAITGWKLKKKVPASVLSEAEFRKYAEKRFNKATRPDDLRVEDLTLKMLGLVPRDYKLKESTLDLMSEQAAAFYDFEKKRLFLVGSKRTNDEDRLALVHELAHAIADQQYPLKDFLQEDTLNDEEAAARQAAAEGQATWLTWAYQNYKGGGQPQPPRYVLETAGVAAAQSSGDFPVFANSPLYIQQSLLFPYTQGLKFQDAVFRKLGRRGFDEVFARAPATTHEILHPEAYLEKWKPATPGLPEIPDAKNFKSLGEGSLGELDHQVLLKQFAGEAESLVAGKLRGSSYGLFEHKKDGYTVLGYVSEWDSEPTAERFFAAYKKILLGKNNEAKFDKDEKKKVEGTGPWGKVQARRDGARVFSVEGLR
jgi:hypothetical protein